MKTQAASLFSSTSSKGSPTNIIEPQLDTLLTQFQTTRLLTEELCDPLITEDYVIQSMPDVSPPKWHLGHTSWFFETFLLAPYEAGYRPFHPRFNYLFNS